MIKVDESELVALLGEHGEHWLKGKWSEGGAMCLHGAIRRCAPVPGDAFLIEQVAGVQGWGTEWNDNGETSWSMVRDRLAHVEVTDADLEVTFGPQWEAIVALVRRAAVLTGDEAKWLFAAQEAAWDAVWVAARDAAWEAAQDAVWVLAVRDLIGQHGFAQTHYDLLTASWAQVIGKVHPDDEEARRG